MAIQQISVFIENKAGRLAEILTILAEAGQDIRAFSVAEKAEFGILRLIVHDPDAAIAELKSKGFTAKKTDVLGILIEDETGASVKAIQLLSAAGINVEYTFAFVMPQNRLAFLLLRVADNDTATKLLEENAIRTANHADVF
ncbi:MAG: amino acid-binding protein [Oscillospiraceae bacterium]|jgi:hypothetical protein|nr:amino acid-binding protein [Oscillospiraceae bacterium]